MSNQERGYEHPARPRGATTRELDILARTHRIACLSSDKDLAGPLRDAVGLIVDLLEQRARIREFGEGWKGPGE